MTSDALVINAVAQVYLDQRCGGCARNQRVCSWHSDAQVLVASCAPNWREKKTEQRAGSGAARIRRVECTEMCWLLQHRHRCKREAVII